jgi:uncharacterized membrane protein YfcA
MLDLMLYLALGIAGGLFAGLLGIGGGLVVVPGLLGLFGARHVPESVAMPLAVGTSLATIPFTSMSSVRAHHARAAVDWPTLARMAPGVALGAALGAALASHVSANGLKIAFAVYATVTAMQMLASRQVAGRTSLPGGIALAGGGGLIGGLSAMAGIGGAALSVPYLLWCRMPLHRAIGTASAIAFPVALAAVVVYVVNGAGAVDPPPWTVGMVYLPALASIAAASVVAAPVGARLAHQLPVATLRHVFALVLLIVAARMLPLASWMGA